MKLDFPTNIDLQTVGVSERGFGTILVFDTNEDKPYTLIGKEELKDLTPETELYKVVEHLFMQKPEPQAVAIYGKKDGKATDLNEIANEDFFFITTTDRTTKTILEVAKFAQTQDKVYGVTIQSEEDVKAFEKVEYSNTFVAYNNNSLVAEGILVIMSYKVGGKTAKFKKVQGAMAADVSPTLMNTLEKANLNTYTTSLGETFFREGTMLDGEWIDVILGKYWVKFRMEEAILALSLNRDKIGYSNTGIADLVGECESVLNQGVAQGIIMANQYVVDYLKREDVPSNKVALRDYPYIKWAAALEGAIHTGPISGVFGYDLVREAE